ncbi:hypothetical protein AVEN_87983-1, partial [Araneus ventricosus]
KGPDCISENGVVANSYGMDKELSPTPLAKLDGILL